MTSHSKKPVKLSQQVQSSAPAPDPYASSGAPRARDEDQIDPLPGELIEYPPSDEEHDLEPEMPRASKRHSSESTIRISLAQGPGMPRATYTASVHEILRDAYEPPEDQENALPGEYYQEPKRPVWESGHHACLLAMLGYGVSIASMYRFPFLVIKNGGLAFVIAYTIVVFLIGFPMLYLELLVGQFCRSGVIRAWYRLVPMFRGVGWTQAIIPLILMMYYNAFLAWAVLYVYHSLVEDVDTIPWVGCHHDWNTLNCRDLPLDFEQVDVTPIELRAGAEYFRGGIQKKWRTKTVSTDFNSTEPTLMTGNETYGLSREDTLGSLSLPSESFPMVGIVLLIYIPIYYYINVGYRYKGSPFLRIMIIFPYIFCMILIFRSMSVPGAGQGFKIMFRSDAEDWAQLAHWRIYISATELLFYTVGIGGGVYLTLASHNEFTTNCKTDAFIFIAINYFSTMMFGIVIFIALGSLAFSDGSSDVNELFENGPHLVFEVCADFWGRIPKGDVFTGLLYGSVLGVGMESSVGSAIFFKDVFFEAFGPWFRRNGRTKWIFLNTVIIMSIFLTSMCMTRGGFHVFVIFDFYTTGLAFLVSSFFFIFGFAWIWGLDEICDAAEAMTGSRPGLFLRFVWKYAAPIYFLALAGIRLNPAHKPRFQHRGKATTFRPEIETLGYILALLPNIFIPIGMISYLLYNTDGIPWNKRLLLGISPTYSHDEILETGRCSRTKFNHLIAFGNRNRLVKTKVNPEKKPEDEEAVTIYNRAEQEGGELSAVPSSATIINEQAEDKKTESKKSEKPEDKKPDETPRQSLA